MIQGVPSHSNFVHGCSTLQPGAELAGLTAGVSGSASSCPERASTIGPFWDGEALPDGRSTRAASWDDEDVRCVTVKAPSRRGVLWTTMCSIQTDPSPAVQADQ